LLKIVVGYIDTTGKVVVPPRFTAASRFSGGLAAVEVGQSAYNIWGYIDKIGKIVIQPQVNFNDNFSEGLQEYR